MTPQASPNRTTLTWLIPITLLVAVCALVGGLIARQVYVVAKPADSGPPAAPAGPPPATSSRGATDAKTVWFTDFARADPQFQAVQIAIQHYFNAVNNKDYGLWRQTMTSDVVSAQTQSQWTNGLDTTKDTDMTVYRIEVTDQGANVFGSFTSHQDVNDAPADLKVPCIDWWMVWPMTRSGDGFRIDGPSVIKKACA